MFSNYSYNDPSSFFGGSPYGQQRGMRYMTPSQYEYLRLKREEERRREEQQRQDALLEERRRERILEEQRQGEQRRRILNRMEEKQRMQRQRQRQRQPAQPTMKTSNRAEEKFVVVQGPDGNFYRIPSSMIRGKSINNPRWVRKVSHDEDDTSSFHDALESMSAGSNESEYHMAQEEHGSGASEQSQTDSCPIRTKAKYHGRKARAPAVVVEDASDSESEDDFIYKKKPYSPGPGESWMEPVQ